MWKALAVSAVLALAALPGQAQTPSIQDRIVQALGEEGFREVRITRTWLGRLRFVAEKPGTEREIVVNPTTGVVYRDYTRVVFDQDDGPGGEASPRSGGGAFWSGGREEDDDGRDDDDSGWDGGASDDDDDDDDDGGGWDDGDDDDDGGWDDDDDD